MKGEEVIKLANQGESLGFFKKTTLSCHMHKPEFGTLVQLKRVTYNVEWAFIL